MNAFSRTLLTLSNKYKTEGRKKLIIGLSMGIGSAFSFVTATILKENITTSVYFETFLFLISSVFLPLSALIGLGIWERARNRWSKSDSALYKDRLIQDLLIELRQEYLKDIEEIKILDLTKTKESKKLDLLHNEYQRKKSELQFEKQRLLLE